MLAQPSIRSYSIGRYTQRKVVLNERPVQVPENEDFKPSPAEAFLTATPTGEGGKSKEGQTTQT